MSKDSENETFEFSDRRAEKEASRREDLERLARGGRVDNRFFSVLDRSHAKLIKRRVRLNIPDALAEMHEIDVQVESRL